MEEEERNTPQPAPVNRSTGQASSDDEVIRHKSDDQADYHIARAIQEEYDGELAQAIHQHYRQQEQPHAAISPPAPQHAAATNSK